MSTEILLVTSWRNEAIKAQYQFGKQLEEHGYIVHILTPISGFNLSDGISGEFITLADYNPTHTLSLENLEEKYNIPSINHLFFTEMKYFALSRDEAINRTKRFASILERIFEKTAIDYVIQGRGGEIHRLLAHYFVEKQNESCIWLEFSPFDNRIAFSTRLNGTWDSYETMANDKIPPDKRKDIDEYIEAFSSTKKVYKHSKGESDNQAIRNTVSTAFSNIKTVFTGTTPNNPYRYGARKSRKTISSKINKLMLPSIKDSMKLCENNNYILFPLQYPVESRLTIFSPEFYDQSFLIEYLSRILPENTKLFVKQHPNHSGQQSPLWIQKVENNRGVKLIHPSMNAHDAIINAKGVVVTNNTVGFETLFYNTPLAVLGRAFYEDVPAATRVDNLSSLPEKLSQMMEFGVPDTELRSSIYSLREATYPGFSLHEAAREENTEKISVIIDSLQTFIDEYT